MTRRLHPMTDRDALVEDKARTVPEALLCRDLFQILQDAAFEMINIFESMRPQVC